MTKKLNRLEIVIPDKCAVFEDRKTLAKTVAFPIKFGDEVRGAVMITKVQNDKWSPSKEIKSITIEFI
jgi:hypothetical protein